MVLLFYMMELLRLLLMGGLLKKFLRLAHPILPISRN